MKRRDFIKSGLASLVSTRTLGSQAFAERGADENYEEGRKLTLGNQYMDWNLLMTGGTLRSTNLRNKLSNRDYSLADSREFQIIVSTSRSRIEIPWWYVCAPGSQYQRLLS